MNDRDSLQQTLIGVPPAELTAGYQGLLQATTYS
jgi:hypothetical protein